jgi:glycosyltransferase involved in cell wall biosynthesis
VKVGIWCAYGKTLTLTDGIGVFAHGLAKYLAQSPRVNAVVLAIHRGDDQQVAATVAAGGGKIKTVALETLPLKLRWQKKALRWRHRSLSRRHARVGGSGGMGRQHLAAGLEAELLNTESQMAGLLARQAASDPALLASPEEGGCDVWVLPHVSVERSFQSATVVLIHDMVPLREPGLVKPHDLASFRRRSQAIANRSTLIGCMSEVIRDEDIVGLLGCPVEKVRVVDPAIPDDIGAETNKKRLPAEQSDCLPAGVAAPYLLYPAAFRPYKNHELLIDALPHLDRNGRVPLQLVFTGGPTLPKELEARAATLGVRERVHALGRVDRETLELLYQQAEATVVPSRHEQGSFPVLEALACGCPVAVSDIPSLRAAFAAAGDAIPFFSPASPEALAGAVAMLQENPIAVREAQAAGFAQLRSRGWNDAIDEWIDVFAEAIERHREIALQRD